jgi:acetylornithine deacetylase/succinyl-diaminopimelate desuccinylase-like protein
MKSHTRFLLSLCLLTGLTTAVARAATAPDWVAIENEALEHFQALVRFDTTDPPGREKEAADYLVRVLEAEGIPVQVFAKEAHRPNVVARLKGNGTKAPLLIMAHTDTVNVDPAKWDFGPFSATRNGGYVYGRGTVDDKDNVTAALMVMLTLKRLEVPLDRDVIFLAEAGEEGATQIGIQFMVDNHFDAIEAEFCYAEGGGVSRQNGVVRYAGVQTMEKIPRRIQLTARGPAGHGSIPLMDNAVLRLSTAVSTIGQWRVPIRLNETTRAFFERLASISPPEDAQRYLDVMHADPVVRDPADDYLRQHRAGARGDQ